MVQTNYGEHILINNKPTYSLYLCVWLGYMDVYGLHRNTLCRFGGSEYNL